jgi:ATP-binding cassette subfamily B protein
LLAKVASTLVPFAYKGIIDTLDSSGPETAVLLGLSVPIILVIAYGIGQIVDTGFQQLRDILFASVGQNAVRQLAYRTFTHVHRLSLRFHLQRKTGGNGAPAACRGSSSAAPRALRP